jgi:hypothetical protein
MSSDVPAAGAPTGSARSALRPGPGAPLELHCFGGQPAAPELLDDVRRLLALPAEARRRVWQVLGPSLPDTVAPEVDALIVRFAAAHEVDSVALARALKGCRALVRQASAGGLPPKLFAEDLMRIAGGSPELAQVLLPGYERVKDELRRELLGAAVADHGKLLEDVRFRVDLLTASDRGLRVRFPAVTLTLHYREGSRREQITLQLLPEVVKQFQRMCEHVLRRP